jgi:hypothetical protein
MTPEFAAVLRDELSKAGVTGRVFEGDALDPKLDVPRRHYRLVVLAEVTSHFRDVSQLRTLLERAAEWLAPGGLLLFSIFLSADVFEPDAQVREFAEVMWCCAFTRKELDGAAAGLPFTKVSDESVHDYEHAHLDASAWPPTGWFVQWTSGRDVFDVPAGKAPLELRWVVYRREP